MLTLKSFRVTSFRSVHDSGWIDVDKVTALIGTNESGKTNLLVPLWKLNPAKGGEIDPIADFPRAEYNRMRNAPEDRIFIQAEFEPADDIKTQLGVLTGVPAEKFDRVRVARRFKGEKVVSFPLAQPPKTVPKTEVIEALSDASKTIGAEKAAKGEDSLKSAMAAAITAATKQAEALTTDVDMAAISTIQGALATVNVAQAAAHSTLAPRWNKLSAALAEFAQTMSRPSPEQVAAAIHLVVSNLPSFVYYSNYGNLDSEIYLPHVIENMKRKDLGTKEAAKARTLRVLFEYVKLTPEEILQLGAPAPIVPPATEPTPEAIELAASQTKERDILLRSADTDLTKSFRDWWKQGDYRFRFGADGDHFRIWVSDDKRPEEIELEARSTGLQWFFSFFLVFLVERADAHKGAVLLLDEPGLSLHPLSQRDLSTFFESLSTTNPIVYTTHSPFMVDADHLDRVRLVYVDTAGATTVSSDLRATSHATAEGRSVYAVHAALGLSVSTALLQGCTSAVVEGQSDQFYLTAIKTVLVARKKIAPKREILFVPAGGAKGVNAIAPIVAAKDEAIPIVILDDDNQGRQFAETLRKGPIYKGTPRRVLNIKDFAGFEFAEIEDLIPTQIIAEAVSRIVRGQDDDFRDVATTGPIVPQIEAYAQKTGVTLDDGWKVDLARFVKQRLLKDVDKIDDKVLDGWAKLFAEIET